VEFHKATNNKLKNHARMVDREVVLRFAAFRMLFDDYSDFDTLDSFLTHLTKQIDLSKIDETELVEVVADFKRSMNNAVKLFGKHAFRKWPQGVERANPFNRALFDSWSVLLADFEWKQLSKSKTKIVDSARKLMTWDREFLDSITTATNTAKRIKTRFGKIREILEEFATE
jgi:hypothetical protein